MNEKKHAAVGVQVCTMLFGLSAVIAKDLSLPASTIVAGRALWAAISLGLLVILFRRNDWNRLTLHETGHLLINGVLLAGHWLCFFYGIVEGGVAVGTLGFASFPVFVSLLEKTFFNKPIAALKVWCTALIAAGLLIISPDIFYSSQLGSGLAWSLAAGFSYALIVLYNRHTASNVSPIQASFIQFTSCTVVTFPWGYSSLISINYSNLLGLTLLGVLCTAVAYTCLIFAIKKVEAGKAAIIISLEPVWAIFFAAIWLHEVPTINTFIGGSMVISAVILSSRESLSEQNGQRS